MSRLRKIGTVTLNHYEARIYRDAEWEEWRVKLYIHGQYQVNSDYHTNDKSDACQTAEVMVIPRFEKVSCSQCGKEFGPRNSGFSHCSNHKGIQ